MPRPEEVVFPGHERFEDRRRDADQRKLLDEFFDHPTLLAVHRLVHRGLFSTIDYPISTGKEGGVFRATAADGYRAVKIYRVGNTTFRNLPPYAVEELRREASARNFGGLVFAWTRREHTILSRLAEAGVRAPRPYGHFRNVLAMEFIGTVEGAAPRLRDAIIDDPATLYEQLVHEIGTMIRTARLVHGDLSPYNVLYFQDHVVLIDVAQAIAVDHPAARALLERDIGHFARFLVRRGYEVTAAQFLDDVGAETVVPPPRGDR